MPASAMRSRRARRSRPLRADDFAAVPLDDEWLLTIGLLADACTFVGDSERAATLYSQLEPYADCVLVGPVEIAHRVGGATAREPRGARWAARTTPSAGSHAPRVRTTGAGARPWAAHARLDHARLLLAEGDPGAAETLLEQAAATYRELGMHGWAASCRAAGRGLGIGQRRRSARLLAAIQSSIRSSDQP